MIQKFSSKGREGISFIKAISTAVVPAAATLLTLAIATGCLPTNNLSSSSSSKKTTYNGAVGTSSSSSGSGSTIPDQCMGFDAALPERTYCISCYNEILSNRCLPGETLATCSDTSVAQNPTSIVNICVSNSVVAGFTCSTTCPSQGTVLNVATCSCVASTSSSSSSSSGSGSGSGSSSGSGGADTGQTDYGPPVAKIIWPGAYVSPTPGTTSKPSTADVPVYFDVKNRGSSIPRLNVYNYVGQWPGNFSTYVTGVTAPALVPNSSLVRSTISVRSSDANTSVFSPFVYFDDFEKNETRSTISVNGATLQDSTSYFQFGAKFSRYLGNFKKDDQVKVTFNNLYMGPYLLTFDLYLIDDWQGAQPSPIPSAAPTPTPTVSANPHPLPHTFVVTGATTDQTGSPTTTTVTIFKESLSSNSAYSQSYKGKYTFRGGAEGVPTATDFSPDADFPISARFDVKCAGDAINGKCNLVVSFQGQNLLFAEKQLWGIDNIGLMPLREFAVKYTITDTNQLSSAYCMWFEQYLSCSNPGNGTGTSSSREECSTWVGPKASEATGEYFLGVSPNPTTKCPVSDFTTKALPTIFQSVDTTTVWLYSGKHSGTDCAGLPGTLDYANGTPVCKATPPDGTKAECPSNPAWKAFTVSSVPYSILTAASTTYYETEADCNAGTNAKTCSIDEGTSLAQNALSKTCMTNGWIDSMGCRQADATVTTTYKFLGCY